MSELIKSYSLSDATITSLNGKTYVMVDGQVLAAWDGTNQAGVPVSNGAYYMQVSSTDAEGVVTNVSQVVTVSRSLAKIEVDVYNEAGEVVRHLYSYVDDPGNAPLGGVQLSTGMSGPTSGTPTPGGNSAVTILFNGTSVVWDGKSDSGAMVTNGNYQVEVHFVDGNGGEEVVSKGVIVEHGGTPVVDGTVYAQPNVVKGATSTLVKINATGSYTLTVHLYDTAGELVKAPVTGQAGSKNVPLDLSGLASGLYFAVVDLTDLNGHFVQKQVTQLVIER